MSSPLQDQITMVMIGTANICPRCLTNQRKRLPGVFISRTHDCFCEPLLYRNVYDTEHSSYRNHDIYTCMEQKYITYDPEFIKLDDW